MYVHKFMYIYTVNPDRCTHGAPAALLTRLAAEKGRPAQSLEPP